MVTLIQFLFLGIFFFLIAGGKMGLWFAFLLGCVVLAFFFGRFYCGYICPMNTLMGPVEKFSKKSGLQTQESPPWLRNGYFTWISFALSLVLMLVLQRLYHIQLPLLLIWLVLALLLTLRYKPGVFHNLICPFAALFSTTGRAALWSKRVHSDTCIGCKKCERVCPSRAIAVNPETRKAVINPGLCHQCQKCTEACPTSAICYRRYRKRKP